MKFKKKKICLLIVDIILTWILHQIIAAYQKFQAFRITFFFFHLSPLFFLPLPNRQMRKHGLHHHLFSAEQFLSFWLLKPELNSTKINNNPSSHMQWSLTYRLIHSAVVKLLIHEMLGNCRLNSSNLWSFLVLNELVLLIRFIWWDLITQQLVQC